VQDPGGVRVGVGPAGQRVITGRGDQLGAAHCGLRHGTTASQAPPRDPASQPEKAAPSLA
jgi:hypothetical protein